MPATTFVLADSDGEAQEVAREVRLQQVSGPTAIKLLEQLWNRDLSAYDPDGPLPASDPLVSERTIAQGRASARMYKDPIGTANEWRQRAEADGLSIRELIIEVTGRQSFIGSPRTIATTMEQFVKERASDGFILVPHITPGGLDDFVERVIPILQEHGTFRAEYDGATLRDHLGIGELKRRPSVARTGT
jgi:alkanesulfonate monooxygenase SsuD/methylene tetrahydromethanopterin reductase-like flavin-dependent oxidoreductase (luciferase family)